MDLSEHFRVIWRRRWRVAVASLVVAAVVAAWSLSKPPVYEATTDVSVTSGRATAGESVTKDDTLFLAGTYAELAETRPVLAAAASGSGLDLSPTVVGQRLSASSSSDVGFVTISATGPSPDEASALAGAAAEALIEAVSAQQEQILREVLGPVESEIEELAAQLGSIPADAPDQALEARYAALLASATERRLQPVDRLTVVSPARAEPTPVSPRPVRDATLALLVALVLNSELAVVLSALNDRFSTEDAGLEATELTGLPILSRIPASGEEGTLEAFRTLRTNLMFMDSLERMRTVAVVSVDPSAGKTFTSVNLARAAASLAVPVALVDADLRRPSVHDYLGIPVTPGLSELLRGTADLNQVVKRSSDDEGLHVLTGGSAVVDASRLVGSQELAEVLERLDWAGLVVVDTPASGVFADALAIASRCDATLLVIDLATSKRRTVRSMVQQLEQVGAKPIGVVLNRTDPVPRSSYYYGRRPRATKLAAPHGGPG